jgi:hypothetical protein
MAKDTPLKDSFFELSVFLVPTAVIAFVAAFHFIATKNSDRPQTPATEMSVQEE